MIRSASWYVFALTAICLVGDVVTYVTSKQIPDLLGNATLILVGASAGVTVPSSSTSAPTNTNL